MPTTRQKTTEISTPMPSRARGRPKKMPKIDSVNEDENMLGDQGNSLHEVGLSRIPGLQSGIGPSNNFASLASKALALQQPTPVNQEADHARLQAVIALNQLYSTADGVLNKTLMLERCTNTNVDPHAKISQTITKISTALDNPHSAFSSKVKLFAPILQQEKEELLDVDDPFLHLSIIQPKITPDPNRYSDLIEAILSKINLALLAVQLQIHYREKSAPDNFTRELDSTFPTPFVNSFLKENKISTSRLFEETFSLALDLRTLTAIQGLQNDDSLTLEEFFYDDDTDISVPKRLKLFQDDSRNHVNNHAGKLEQVQNRLNELEKVFGGNYKKSNPKNKIYSWKSFVLTAMMWIQNRNEELTGNLRHNGFMGDMGDLNVILSEGIPGAGKPIPQTIAPILQQRSMLDPQPNAKQIPFESQSPYSQNENMQNMNVVEGEMRHVQNFNQHGNFGNSSAHPPSSSHANNVKHDLQFSCIPQQQAQLSQDIGFAGPADSSQPNAPKTMKRKTRQAQKYEPPSPQPEPSQEELGKTKQRCYMIGNSYSQVSDQYKRNGQAQAPTQAPDKGRARKKWSAEETGRLIELVGELGPHWAVISTFDKTNGNLLANRDQGALKDKARNIKFDLLKADVKLPSHFAQVTLNQSMKKKLEIISNDRISRGLPPLSYFTEGGTQEMDWQFAEEEEDQEHRVDETLADGELTYVGHGSLQGEPFQPLQQQQHHRVLRQAARQYQPTYPENDDDDDNAFDPPPSVGN